MHCVVTGGPTFEPLDKVRRLTNFSTGRLATELSNHLVRQGHRVTLLLGEQSTYKGACHAQQVVAFSTTDDLACKLQNLRPENVHAICHAAAVSDFKFGKVFARTAEDGLREVTSGKFGTREGVLMAELVPTPKILSKLRAWFPDALLAGWKYEVDGGLTAATAMARRQMAECRTDVCVLNGPAYGDGFGVVGLGEPLQHCPEAPALFSVLGEVIESRTGHRDGRG